jgi:hypothetical protein
MALLNIPHADQTFIEMRSLRILHVTTTMPKRSGTPGFNALSWYEMMKAIAEVKTEFDTYEIHSSDDPEASRPWY